VVVYITALVINYAYQIPSNSGLILQDNVGTMVQYKAALQAAFMYCDLPSAAIF
jgi:hypothetical protein